MSVRIHVPIFYRSDSNESETFVDGCRTVADCVTAIVKQYPDFRKMLFDKKGRLQTWVGVYFNGGDAFSNELAKPVKDGDEIRLFLYLSV